MKPYQLRIRVCEADQKIITALSEDSGVSIADIATMILHAGARAIDENNGRLPLPLRFTIEGAEPSKKADFAGDPAPRNASRAAPFNS